MYDYVCIFIYIYIYIYMCLWVFPLFFGLMSCETSIILGLVSVWRLKYDHCGSFEFTGWCWNPDISPVDICHSRIPSRISSRYSPFWLTKPPYWLVMLLILTSFPTRKWRCSSKKTPAFRQEMAPFQRETVTKIHAHMTHYSNSNLPYYTFSANSYQWEFQDPKLEVLYHIRPFFWGIFPYIGLI